MTPQEALIARFAGSADPDEQDEWWTTPRSIAEVSLAALTDAGMVIVPGNDLLDVAGLAGADTSDLDDYRQLVQPTLIEYLTEAVRNLRDDYRECLEETKAYDASMPTTHSDTHSEPDIMTTLVTDTATGDQWRVPTRAVEAIVAALDATKEAE